MSFRKKFVELYKAGKVDDTTMYKMAAFEEELKKEADWKSGVIHGLGVGVGLAALKGIDYGIRQGMASFEDKKTGQSAEANFEIVYAREPSINRYPKDEARRYFETLLHFAPHMAIEPIATTSWLKEALEWKEQGTEPHRDLIKSLAETQNKIDTGKSQGDFGGYASNLSTFVSSIKSG